MAMLFVDKYSREFIVDHDADRIKHNCDVKVNIINLPIGSIEKLTGLKLNHKDEPINYPNYEKSYHVPISDVNHPDYLFGNSHVCKSRR